MRKRRLFGVLIFAIPAVLAVATMAVAGDSGTRNFRAGMIGYQEVPAISTVATGSFQAHLVNDNTLEYELTYSGVEGVATTQAHIHFGQRSVNGGISVWLCSNLASPPTPAGTQACPATSGTVTGTITAANVVGPSGQGIAAGEFNELVRALRAGVAYANVHSQTYPGGEFRGQINDRSGDNDDDDDDDDDD
jgi:hypothetical protein